MTSLIDKWLNPKNDQKELARKMRKNRQIRNFMDEVENSNFNTTMKLCLLNRLATLLDEIDKESNPKDKSC